VSWDGTGVPVVVVTLGVLALVVLPAHPAWPAPSKGPPPPPPQTSAQIAAQPGRPTGVTGAAGNGAVAVAWTAPLSGGQVTGYTATASPGGAICTVPAPTTSCTVSGLTNGTAYTFTVVATNTHSSSVPSVPSAPVTPFQGPDPPTGVTPRAGDSAIAVTWTAPASFGTGTLVGYTATASPGGTTCTSPSATSCVLTGLTNGVFYRVVVTVTTQYASAASVASGPVSPFRAPSPPTGVTAVAGNASVAVSWSAPTDPGSGTLTGYIATAIPDGNTCATPDSAVRCTITGLTNGITYVVTVVASSTVGASVPSAPSAPATPEESAALPPFTELPTRAAALTSSAGGLFTAWARTTTLTGTGFAPRTWVRVGIYPERALLTTTITDGQGGFQVLVTIPAGSPGEHTLVAVGLSRDRHPRVATLVIRIGAPVLVVTGAETTDLLLAGMGLVVAGIAAVAVCRPQDGVSASGRGLSGVGRVRSRTR
jgi:hypothetical protein